MSRANPYASIEKRRFENALVYMLQKEYGFMQGGRRILQLLSADVMDLIEEFYPDTRQAESGTLVWTCTANEGKKAEPGKRTEEYKMATVQLPLVTKEELQERTERKAKSTKQNRGRERDKKRAVRLVETAAAQGGLLTIVELSVIMNRSNETIRSYLQQWREETGKLLPLKGYCMDQGSSPTHKKAIIQLFEQGLEPPDIARETNHSLKSVERYLKDYERVKMLGKQGMNITEMSRIIGRGQKVLQEYIKIARQYHPDLFQETSQNSE